MSEDNVTQAVVEEPKASAKPDVAADNARVETDDLDSLLASFDGDSKTGAAETKPKPETNAGDGGDLKALTAEVKGQLSELQQEKFRKDMDSTINRVRGDLASDYFDDTFVEAWLDAEARKDPRLAKAWTDRNANPKQFQKVVDQLGRTFAKKYGKLPDAQATEDRAAVAAAVRGASTQAPEGKAPDYKGKSDAEFREDVRKNYGFTPI